MRIVDSVDFETVSHELKTPISVLLMQLELINYYLDDRMKLLELISVVSQNSRRLARFTGNILDILRIDAGNSWINLTDVDIISFIKNISDSAEPYAKEKAIKLICEAPLYSKIIPVDTEKMEKIVFNLISNAIKYTGENGGIILRVDDNARDGIIISVEDTGEGIPEDKLDLIFDRPAHVNSPLTRKTKGCGVGLALVKSYVEMLGGKIMVNSKVGVGSKFSIELPIAQTVSDTHISVYGMDLAKKAEIELSDIDMKY